MDFEGFAKKLERDIQGYYDFQAENAIAAGLDLIALMRLRIQERGEDFEESKFNPYSVDYEQLRAEAGYQTDHVDFTRTGKMMASIVPTIEEESEGVAVVLIKSSNDSDQTKINGAYRKRGNILLNTDEELDLALRGFNERGNEKLSTLFK